MLIRDAVAKTEKNSSILLLVEFRFKTVMKLMFEIYLKDFAKKCI